MSFQRKFGLSDVGVQRLQRIKRIILEEPKRFFMEGYYRGRGIVGGIYSRSVDDATVGVDREDVRFQERPACGTTACICGWARILEQAEDKTHWVEDSELTVGGLGNQEVAAKWLEMDKNALENELYDSLFYSSRWPTDFFNAYHNAKSPAEAAQAAASYIDCVCGLTPAEGEAYLKSLPPETFDFSKVYCL